ATFSAALSATPDNRRRFITEATNIERAFKHAPATTSDTRRRCSRDIWIRPGHHPPRHPRNYPGSRPGGTQEAAACCHKPATPSVAEIVREEVQQALQPEVLASAAPEPPTLSYAAVARRPPPPAHPYTAPPRREPLRRSIPDARKIRRTSAQN
ncbi:hypothetical protein ISCGN_003120, partial [Ixodes scapularis]